MNEAVIKCLSIPVRTELFWIPFMLVESPRIDCPYSSFDAVDRELIGGKPYDWSEFSMCFVHDLVVVTLVPLPEDPCWGHGSSGVSIWNF